MSERGDEFRLMLKRELHYAWRPDVWRERGSLERASKHARSICEHLGITWEDVDALNSDLANLRDQVDYGPEGIEVWIGPEQQRIGRVHDAIATLLEAAGIER